MKTFVIGISGVTNGGKTTLAKNLQKRLQNCSVISQDDFFKPESEIRTDENGFLQYDVYLDGTKSEKDLFSQVYEDLIQELAKQKGKYCPSRVDCERAARRIVHFVHKNRIPEC
ncbi:Nicotinamide riboside kinase 1 [Camelus dromedarius]|uniref:Nicotinamide riboside kinase 1 n=1 Tax=Camelus dromedarius TaxID=9838 RepID=A0A5N4EAL6_CAMDR|nr:Nicotinamide riboside kinase 1 [Camelus dromedarius]